jgi:hypothetical protein
MPYVRESIGPKPSGAPKDGQERIVTDRDGSNHLEYFMNGSWRHSTTICKKKMNPACTRSK